MPEMKGSLPPLPTASPITPGRASLIDHRGSPQGTVTSSQDLPQPVLTTGERGERQAQGGFPDLGSFCWLQGPPQHLENGQLNTTQPASTSII